MKSARLHEYGHPLVLEEVRRPACGRPSRSWKDKQIPVEARVAGQPAYVR